MTGEWRPIETAPKDGTPFIAANSYDAFRAFFDVARDCWVAEDTEEPFAQIRYPPTHWISLPPETTR